MRYALLAALERSAQTPTGTSSTSQPARRPDQIVQATRGLGARRVGPASAPAVTDLVEVAGDTGRLVDPRWSAVVALGRLGQVRRGSAGAGRAARRRRRGHARGERACPRRDRRTVRGVSALEAALADRDQLVRDGAALGLGAIGPRRRARSPPRGAHRRRLASRPDLGAGGPRPDRRHPSPGGASRRTASDAIVAAELPRRLAGLESESERTRGISTFEIGKLGPGAAEAVPLLADLLATDHNLDVRWSAAWAFGKMGGAAAAALPALARAVGVDADPDVRAQAAWAIARIAGECDRLGRSRGRRFSSARFAIPTRSCARRLPKGSGTWVGRPRGTAPASPSLQVTATRSSGVERSLRSPP